MPHSPIVAFFDMDHTVLTVNSAARWAKFMYSRGELGLRDMMNTARWLMQYKLAMLDAADVSRRAMATVEGAGEAEMIALCEEWFEDDIRHTIAKQAVECIENHKEKGHRVVLLTAATPYIGGPLARHIGLDDCIGTQLEVQNGVFTGKPVEPLCYAEGKIHWASQWVEAHNASFEQAYFYSDSYTDRPMLDAVAHPVAVNPDPRLKRYARQQKMPIEMWR